MVIMTSILDDEETIVGVRTTIQLDDALLDRLRQLVPPRGLNRFINRAIEDKVRDLERSQLEELMKEGYLALRQDREELNADWQAIDGENWPE
jgi:metal-responsive CopG/Arc/MetJ family transcriptional regulator